MSDCPTCGRRMDMIVGMVNGPRPEMPDLPQRIEVFKETFFSMRDQNDAMRPVFDAAMALLEASEFDEDGCPVADYKALCQLMAACRRAREGG